MFEPIVLWFLANTGGSSGPSVPPLILLIVKLTKVVFSSCVYEVSTCQTTARERLTNGRFDIIRNFVKKSGNLFIETILYVGNEKACSIVRRSKPVQKPGWCWRLTCICVAKGLPGVFAQCDKPAERV